MQAPVDVPWKRLYEPWDEEPLEQLAQQLYRQLLMVSGAIPTLPARKKGKAAVKHDYLSDLLPPHLSELSRQVCRLAP